MSVTCGRCGADGLWEIRDGRQAISWGAGETDWRDIADELAEHLRKMLDHHAAMCGQPPGECMPPKRAERVLQRYRDAAGGGKP